MPVIYKTKSSICDVCLRPSSKICTACHYARYCSAECQRVDWSSHRAICRDLTVSAYEEARWLHWFSNHDESMAQMIVPDETVDIQYDGEIYIVNNYSTRTYMSTLSAADREHLMRYIAAETTTAGRTPVSVPRQVEHKEYQVRTCSRVDRPTDVSHVDGVTVTPATAVPPGYTLFRYSYTAGPRWELLRRAVPVESKAESTEAKTE